MNHHFDETEDQNFSIRLISLLMFYKRGTRATFSKIVDKALGEKAVNLSNLERRNTDILLFNRLSDFGLIESSELKTEWVALKNGCIPLELRNVLIFGGYHYVRRILDQVQREDVMEHVLYELPFTSGTGLSLVLPKVNATKILSDKSIDIFAGWCREAERLFVNKETLIKAALEPGRDLNTLANLGPLSVFDFNDFDWKSTLWSDIENGLVRTSYDRARGEIPRIFLVRSQASETSLLEVKREATSWQYFIAGHMLGMDVGITYRRKAETLSVKSLNVLPIFFRRLLCSRPMRWPKKEQTGDYLFDQVDGVFFKTIKARFSFIGEEYGG